MVKGCDIDGFGGSAVAAIPVTGHLPGSADTAQSRKARPEEAQEPS